VDAIYTARSKASYDKDLMKSHVDTATPSKASYDKDPESGTKSIVRVFNMKGLL